MLIYYILQFEKNLTSKSNYCEFMNLFKYITLLFFKYQNDTDNHFLDEFCDLKKKKKIKNFQFTIHGSISAKQLDFLKITEHEAIFNISPCTKPNYYRNSIFSRIKKKKYSSQSPILVNIPTFSNLRIIGIKRAEIEKSKRCFVLIS